MPSAEYQPRDSDRPSCGASKMSLADWRQFRLGLLRRPNLRRTVLAFVLLATILAWAISYAGDYQTTYRWRNASIRPLGFWIAFQDGSVFGLWSRCSQCKRLDNRNCRCARLNSCFVQLPSSVAPDGTVEIGPLRWRLGPVGPHRDGISAGVRFWFLALVAAGLMLTNEYFVYRKRRIPGHCKSCDYNLTGNISGVCPECGTQVEE